MSARLRVRSSCHVSLAPAALRPSHYHTCTASPILVQNWHEELKRLVPAN
jgi:hypothetical protein